MEIDSTSAVRAINSYQSHVKKATESMERIGSGSTLSPVDDAGGVVVASRLETQASRVNAARSNLANSLSKIQTADGYLSNVTNALQRMGELAAMAMDNTKSATDKKNYNTEFQALKAYIRDVATRQMNGQNLFDGSSNSVIKDDSGNFYSYNNANLTAAALTDLTTGDVDSVDEWETSINLWKVSKAGYILNQESFRTTENSNQLYNATKEIYRLKQNMWYTGGDVSNWSTTNNGGTFYAKDSFIKIGYGSGSQNIESSPAWFGLDYTENFGAGNKHLSTLDPLALGNLESSDVTFLPSGSFVDFDPSTSSNAPGTTTFASGTFFATDPGMGANQTAVAAGDYITVNPASEDPGATYYAAGSTVGTDPTSTDSGATELGNTHVLTSLGAGTVISKIKTALGQVTTDRSSLGSAGSRLQRINEHLSVLGENLAQAVSRMKDTRVASESTRLAKHQILIQSSLDMVDKARIVNENNLRLLMNY